MTPWLFVAIVAEAGVIAALVLRLQALGKSLDQSDKALKLAEVLWAQRAANYEDALKRRDELEKGLHHELEQAEGDRAVRADPDALRARLGRLLRGTATADALATESWLPPKPTA